MSMKKTIKKIIAIGTGMTLVGSTLMGATATMDLSNYPKPFVNNGDYDATIVVGDTAAPADIIGAIDVAASLQYNMKVLTETIIQGKTSTTIANAKKISSAGTRLKYGDVFTDIVETVMPDDLPTVLIEEEELKGDDDIYEYKTSIKVPNTEVAFGEPGDLDSPIIHLDFNNGVSWKSVVEFSPALDPKDVMDERINLFGKEYTFSGEENELERDSITLYAGALDQTFSAGAVQTVELDNKDIDIEVIGVNTQSDDPSATLSINGETKQIDAGESYTIGGIEIYVKDIFAYTAPTTSGAVRLFIGSNKLILEDGSNVEMGKNSEEVEGTNVIFTNSGDKISKIEIEITPSEYDNEIEYTAIGDEGIIDPVFGTYKISLHGMYPSIDTNGTKIRDKIKLSPNSDDLKVVWTNKDNIEYSMNMFYTVGNNEVKFGNGNDKIITTNGATIEKNDFFIISEKGYSHILQLTRARNDEIRVSDDGKSHTFSVSNNVGTMYFNGYSYNFNYIDRDKIEVINGLTDTVITHDGAKLMFTVDEPNCPQYLSNAIAIDGTICNKYKFGLSDILKYMNDSTVIGTHDGIEINPGSYYIKPIDCNNIIATFNFDINSELFNSLGFIDIDKVNNLDCTSNENYNIPVFHPNYYSGNVVDEQIHKDNLFCDSREYNSIITYGNTLSGNIEGEVCPIITNSGVIIFDERSDYNEASGTAEEDATTYEFTFTSDNDGDMTIDLNNEPDTYNINDGDNYESFTPYGTLIKSGDSDKDVTLYYYEDATIFDAFITPVDSEIVTTSDSSSYLTENTEKISVGMAKLASEVSDITAENIISIGGPCVNVVSAALMGNPSNCAEGFIEGKAIIKLFEQTGNNVAMMIAGYSADDTKRATRVVSDFNNYEGFEGTEIEVTGTSMTDIKVGTPVITTTTTTTTTLEDEEVL